MKVTVAQIVASSPALKKLGSLECLSAKQASSVARMLRKAQEYLGDFEKGKMAAIKKHGPGDENREALDKDIREALSVDADLDCNVVEISADATGLTPHDFNALEPFITVK